MAAPVKLSHPPTKGFWEVPVLYEDEALLALDKPASLCTAPEPAMPDSPDLMSLLHHGIQNEKPWARDRNVSFLKNAHRIDPAVSGVLLLARTQAALTGLANAFGSEKPERRYLALVQGNLDEDAFEVDARLAQHPEIPGLTRVDSRHGKKSRTRFEVAERFSGWTLLACVPHPDRPGQVRAHLRYKWLSLAGDTLYRGATLRLSSIKPGFRLKPKEVERPLMLRPALHLERITFIHPVTGVELTVSAPLPKDLTVALKYLRKYASGRETRVPEQEFPPYAAPPKLM